MSAENEQMIETAVREAAAAHGLDPMAWGDLKGRLTVFNNGGKLEVRGCGGEPVADVIVRMRSEPSTAKRFGQSGGSGGGTKLDRVREMRPGGSKLGLIRELTPTTKPEPPAVGAERMTELKRHVRTTSGETPAQTPAQRLRNLRGGQQQSK